MSDINTELCAQAAALLDSEPPADEAYTDTAVETFELTKGQAFAIRRALRDSVAFLLGFFVMYNVSAVWRQDPEAWAFCRELYASSDFESPAERVDRNAVWSVYCGDVFKRWSKQIDQVAPTPPQ